MYSTNYEVLQVFLMYFTVSFFSLCETVMRERWRKIRPDILVTFNIQAWMTMEKLLLSLLDIAIPFAGKLDTQNSVNLRSITSPMSVFKLTDTVSSLWKARITSNYYKSSWRNVIIYLKILKKSVNINLIFHLDTALLRNKCQALARLLSVPRINYMHLSITQFPGHAQG